MTDPDEVTRTVRKMVAIRFDPDVLERFDALAAQRDLTRTALLEQLMIAALAAEEERWREAKMARRPIGRP